MWLIDEIESFGGWAFSISRKILAIAPRAMVIVVLATLASQIFRLLAFLLPVKMVLLIGSSGVPRYFPPILVDSGRNNLVIWLGVATIGFFLSHLAAEKTVNHFTERTADRVLTRSDKLALFRNQDSVARTACRRFAETIAAAIFVGLAVSLIVVVHSSVAVLLTAWGLSWFAGAAITGAVNVRFRSWLKGNATNYANTAASTGFFAVTALFIVEFVSGAELHILFAIVSIILSRQVLSRGSKIVSNALTLTSRKLLINALFFHGHLWRGNALSRRRRSVWDLLAVGEQQQWLPGLLERAIGKKVESAAVVAWHQTGLRDVLAVETVACHWDGKQESYFVKMYGRGKDLGASHEAALQAACGPGRLPAPLFLGKFDVEEFTFLVHENLGAESLDGDERSQLRMAAFAECWSVELPLDLVNRFKRTHRLLHQRLLETDLDRLAHIAFDQEQRRQVNEFGRNLEPLCAWLGNVPQALYNPDINPDSLFVGADGSLVITHWGRWAIEPVGAGWSINDKSIEALPDWLRAAQQRRSELLKVTPSDAWLAALLSEFEKTLRKQKMERAMSMLSAILAEMAQREDFTDQCNKASSLAKGPVEPATEKKAKRLTMVAPKVAQ